MKDKPKKAAKKPDTTIAVVPAKHEFTDKELKEISQSLAGELNKKRELEEQLKHVSSDFKSRIKGAEALIGELTNKVSGGYEMRPTRVRVEFEAKRGKKKLYREQDGTFLCEQDMTPADFERPLPFEQPPAKVEKPKRGKKGFNPVIAPNTDVSHVKSDDSN